jgi:predicted metalloprotease
MLNRIFRQRTARSIAAIIGFGVPGATFRAPEPVDPPARARLTADDIPTSEEVAAAYKVLVAMWTDEFRAIGKDFVPPKLFQYRGNLRTECGVMPAYNANYCLDNNTIYYDDAFLSGEAKRTARALGTDGDMAAVGIVAHEMGHAVAMQLGFISKDSYETEAVADCLAGAFARYAEGDGMLESGDLDEAAHAIAAAADPELKPTGNRRLDRRRAQAIAKTRHGTRAQRIANFRNGYDGGSGECLDALR